MAGCFRRLSEVAASDVEGRMMSRVEGKEAGSNTRPFSRVAVFPTADLVTTVSAVGSRMPWCPCDTAMTGERVSRQYRQLVQEREAVYG